MKSGIVFDLDETLIDRRATLEAYAGLLWRDFGVTSESPRSHFVAEFLAMDGDGDTPQTELVAGLVRRFPASLSDPSALSRHFSQFAWTRPALAGGVVAGLAALRAAGVPLGIITNGGADSQRRKLQFTGLDRLVDFVLISEEFGAAKPDRSIFVAMCSALGIDASASWFIGDHPVFDIWGASQVGFRTIWLERSTPWPGDCDRCYTHTFPHVSAALQLLARRA
jgi:putative hydrolase of the HAD superfamily